MAKQGRCSFCGATLSVLIHGKYVSTVAVDDITEFPADIDVNIADIYSKLGLTAPALGEILYLTTNVVLNDGSIIPGWSEVAGFNNKAFAGWLVDGRAYSGSVRCRIGNDQCLRT
jgi:hypothetical protein